MNKKILSNPPHGRFIRKPEKQQIFLCLFPLHGYIYARWIYFYLAMEADSIRCQKRLTPSSGGLVIGLPVKPRTEERIHPEIGFQIPTTARLFLYRQPGNWVSIKEDIDLGELGEDHPIRSGTRYCVKEP